MGRFGKRSLAFDCDQIESVVEPLSELVIRGSGGEKNKNYSEKIENSLKTVIAFQTLLFTKPEAVLSMQALLDGQLKYSIALHFLFNCAPVELKSPHESAGWSISRYSAWLEDHLEESERLQLIKGALESYAAGTRMRREKSYVAPYPIMVQILQTALEFEAS